MSYIQNLFTSRDNNADSSTYVGQEGRLWWDPLTNSFYYSDGSTPGGIPIGGGSGGNGVPGGPLNSVQINGGGGLFQGTTKLTFSGNVLSVTGNVSSTYFIGDGSQLTNLPVQPGTYSNANVTGYLAINTGNISAGDISATGNITGNYFIGNGSQLTGLPASYGNSNVALYLSSGTVSSNIITTANISGRYFLGNGSQLTGIVTNYSNANVQSYLPTYSGNLVSLGGNVTTTANISGAYILGDGSQLTNLPIQPGTYSNANVQNYLPTYTGNLVSLGGNVTTTANIRGNYILGNGSQLTGIVTNYSNANVTSLLSSGTVSTAIITTNNISANNASVTGNITVGNVNATYLYGDGSNITGLPASYGNANVEILLESGNISNNIITTGNITANSYSLGNSSTTYSQTSWFTTSTASTSPTILFVLPTSSAASIDFNITATDITSGTNRQVSKIIATGVGSTVNYTEYGTVNLGSSLGSFVVTGAGSNYTLTVTPTSTDSIVYNVVITMYK